MSLEETLEKCLKYFVGMDETNAAVHCAEVRFSPITFRVAEALAELLKAEGRYFNLQEPLLLVTSHMQKYEEDRGR